VILHWQTPKAEHLSVLLPWKWTAVMLSLVQLLVIENYWQAVVSSCGLPQHLEISSACPHLLIPVKASQLHMKRSSNTILGACVTTMIDLSNR
jgi:hypothetical protein